MIVNIDGDIPCYSISFAVGEDGLQRWCHDRVRGFVDRVMKGAGCTEYKIFLSGKGNFRTAVAKHKPYKGNRVQEKPLHWRYIRDILINDYGAVEYDGIEADDALGLAQTSNTVLATIDKDLQMIPGKHYNWNKEERSLVSQEQADRFFFTQWLTGDSTDNIAGAYKVGKVKAKKYLEECTSNHQMHAVVKHVYLDVCGHDEDYMDEMAQLVWMQRADAITYREFLNEIC